MSTLQWGAWIQTPKHPVRDPKHQSCRHVYDYKQLHACQFYSVPLHIYSKSILLLTRNNRHRMSWTVILTISHHVMAAMLVFPNKGTATMLVSPTKHIWTKKTNKRKLKQKRKQEIPTEVSASICLLLATALWTKVQSCQLKFEARTLWTAANQAKGQNNYLQKTKQKQCSTGPYTIITPLLFKTALTSMS